MGKRGPEKREVSMTIARNLRRFRMDLGLSQEQAAQWLGWAGDTLRRMERGERGMDVGQLMQVADAFGRSMDDFRMETPPARPDAEMPPFRLVVRPSPPLPPALVREAEEAIRSLNARYLAARPSTRSKV